MIAVYAVDNSWLLQALFIGCGQELRRLQPQGCSSSQGEFIEHIAAAADRLARWGGDG